MIRNLPRKKLAILCVCVVLFVVYVLTCILISAKQDPYKVTLEALSPEGVSLAEGAVLEASDLENVQEEENTYLLLPVRIINDSNRMISSQNDYRIFLTCTVYAQSGEDTGISQELTEIEKRVGSGKTGTAQVRVRGLSAGDYRIVLDLQRSEPAFSYSSAESFTADEVLLHVD
ncbi:MAG: hypothetical protein IKR61_09230 [Lachnospiraceae bacterium]|nr:hypothetical protein [Lachnospiraceae bacterium]